MPEVKDLYLLLGEFVNLEYLLPNGLKVHFLDNHMSYFGTQLECLFQDQNEKRYFGLIANMDFILVSEYGEDGKDPELLLYKHR